MRPEDAPLELAQLAHAWLASVSFDELIPLGNWEGNAQYSIKLGEPRVVDSPDRTVTVVRITLEIEWTTLPEGKDTGPFELTLDVAGTFAWHDAEPIDEDFRKSWIDLNAAYLLWPYARAYIATITGMSSSPALTIYTMRVPQVPVRDLQDEQEKPPSPARSTRTAAKRPSTAARRKPPRKR